MCVQNNPEANSSLQQMMLDREGQPEYLDQVNGHNITNSIRENFSLRLPGSFI